MQKQVGLLLFDDVEVLDFAGPFEVFSVTELTDGTRPFRVRTVSEYGRAIRAVNGLNVLPEFSFESCPELDLLIVPGGLGARTVEMYNQPLLRWVAGKNAEVEYLASVCTGAFILAELGLLDGRKATTHWASIGRMRENYPRIEVLEGVKFVDEGHILTAAGISAGIDLSFRLLKKIVGTDTARATAKRMEYDIAL